MKISRINAYFSVLLVPATEFVGSLAMIICTFSGVHGFESLSLETWHTKSLASEACICELIVGNGSFSSIIFRQIRSVWMTNDNLPNFHTNSQQFTKSFAN